MSSATILTRRALALCSLSLCGGCLGLTGSTDVAPQHNATSTPPSPAAATQTPPAVDPAAEREAQNLALVREFLERTRELPPPADSRTEPAGHATSGLDPLTGRGPDTGARIVEPPARPVPTAAPAVAVSAPEPRSLANAQLDLAPPTRMPAVPVVQTVSIRAALPTSTAHTPAAGAAAGNPPGRVTNAPMELDRSFQLQSIDALLADWRRAAQDTSDADAQWRLTMFLLALGRDSEAAELSPNLSPPARQVLATFVPAAAAARAVVRNPMLVDDNQLAPAEMYARSLADLADPFVARIALCRRVVTFGVYDEQAPTDFVAGRPMPTIVYSEIRNFSSQKGEEGYRTVLGTRLEVLTHDGRSVWEQSEPQIEDVSRTRRTDFFLAQRITLPATLPAGEYILKVYIEDKLSSRANESVRPFTIHEQAAVAASRL